MSISDSARHTWRNWRHSRARRQPGPTVWHHAEYRIALEGLGLETKRADLALWALVDQAIIAPEDVQQPRRVGYSELSAVHAPHVLEGLSSAETLAPIFGAHPSELPVERIATTIRLACGATLAGARRAVAGAGPQVNLLGGFHHASPARGGGFSVVNDIAVAIAALRRQGFDERVGVLDLDAHPPDGTADCVDAAKDTIGEVWIGSLSGSDWGELPTVDETVIDGADDAAYLAALDALLERMPSCGLVFILAGGDVLAGDRFGGLALTLGGARRRDQRVAAKLGETPSVWLAAGGYSERAWRVLFNTVSVLALHKPHILPADYQPLRARFSRVASELAPPRDEDDIFTDLDLAE
ncbi:MAG: acetoin utilization deacetylase AcuC-like enzyme, partial [Bradymonadia bacterium]